MDLIRQFRYSTLVIALHRRLYRATGICRAVNSAFYRFGNLAIDDLEVHTNQLAIEQYRNSDILQYVAVDDAAIKELFASFLIALQSQGGKEARDEKPSSSRKSVAPSRSCMLSIVG